MIACAICNDCTNRDDCDGEPERRWWGHKCRNYVTAAWTDEPEEEEETGGPVIPAPTR